MKKLNLWCGVSILLLLAFSSCSPIYVPNYVNAPLFSNQGEVQGGISTGINGTDAYVSGAVTDHIGVTFDYSFSNRKNPDGPQYHKHRSAEGGVGYYKKMGLAGRFECYGGFGKGHSESNGGYFLGTGGRKAEADFYKFYLQPAVGVATDVFDGAMVMRCAYVGLYEAGYYDDSNVFNGLSNQAIFFWEPVLMMRLGYRYVKLTTQAGFSVPLSENYYFEHNPFIFSVGFQLNFGRKWDEKAEKNKVPAD